MGQHEALLACVYLMQLQAHFHVIIRPLLVSLHSVVQGPLGEDAIGHFGS